VSSTRYRAQAADVRASVKLAGAPDVLVAQMAPVVEHATRHVASVEGRDAGRTYTAPTPVHYTAPGHVPVARTFARGCAERCGACESCLACEYPVLDGAPVGVPESLRAFIRERIAQASDAHWARRNERADAGVQMSRSAYRNAKRRAARAQR
jgi:hypothetical protein